MKKVSVCTGMSLWKKCFCPGILLFFLFLPCPVHASSSPPTQPPSYVRRWKQRITKWLNKLNLQAGEQSSISQNNLFGKNIKVTGDARLSGGVQYIRAGLMKKDLLGTPLFLGFDQSGRWEQDDRYRFKSNGQDVYLGMMVTRRTKATLKYEYRNISLYHISGSAPPVFYQDQGTHQVGDIALTLERSTLNDRFYPTKGSDHRLIGSYAVSGLGSDYNLTKVEWQSRFYVTPGKFFTYVFRTKVADVNTLGTKTDGVPFFERYFLGGTSTIRGYKSRQAGPKDNNNLPLGGDLLWVNNFEVRFPIHKKLNGAVFFDAGGLWSHADQFSTGNLRYGTGVGLRYLTPWGVLRLDYGVRLSHETDEPKSSVHATFGIPF